MKDDNFHPEIYNDPAQLTEKKTCTGSVRTPPQIILIWYALLTTVVFLKFDYLPSLILVGNFT